MEIQVSDFSQDQLFFLSTLDACGHPVPLDILCLLVPIAPGSLQQLLDRCETAGWIKKTGEGLISLTRAFPKDIRCDLKLLNTPDRIGALLEHLLGRGLEHRLDKKVLIKLLSDSRRGVDASEMEVELAHEILKQGNHDLAYQHLGQAVKRLHECIGNGDKAGEKLFLKAVLELSNLSFAVGRGMYALLTYLQTAADLAESYGDKRLHALGNLHLGRLESYFGNDSRALELLALGEKHVEMLGDADIMKAAAEFLGLYCMKQGKIDQAIIHFERAEQNFTQNEDRLLFYPMILWNFGICLFLSGRIPRALGFFQGYWRLAAGKGWPGVAIITRAFFGLLLVVAKKPDEAIFHLNAAIRESRATNNAYSLFIARSGLALKLFYDGRVKEAFDSLQTAFKKEKAATSAPPVCSMFFIDLLAGFQEQGIGPVAPGWSYEECLDRYLNKPPFFFHIFEGLALRMRAENKLRQGAAAFLVTADLEASRAHLQPIGADYFLNNTMVSFARLYHREGALREAEETAYEIWRNVNSMGLGEEFLPDDIKALMNERKMRPDSAESLQYTVQRYLRLLNELDNAEDEDDLQYNVVVKLLQFLGAERGALFRVESGKSGHRFLFRAGCNLTRQETESERFRPNRSLVKRAFKENRMIVERPRAGENVISHERPRGILLMPVQIGSQVRGVSYFENAFMEDLFDSAPTSFMVTASSHLNLYIRHLLKNLRLQGEVSRLRSFKPGRQSPSGENSILTQDQNMLRVLALAEKAARSEATLLVTGETGTGKELLVSRIHTMSPRAGGPLIVVDATTIPEHLVESELFGHEKGAFTGADRRKRGRIELAHEGVLFVDEIGELPLPVQAKLLRAIEAREFYRVGGTQSIKSDFRLVAATNRNLAEEVAAGRFRKDLYYRLNVINCVLPPLRDRGNDISLLANHFLEQYCIRYGFGQMRFAHGAEEKMSAYPWPGNIRELKNTIERSVILSNGRTPALDLPVSSQVSDEIFTDMPSMEEMQRRYIRNVLEKTGGRIDGPDGAASILGMKRSTLYSRMYKLGMRKISSTP